MNSKNNTQILLIIPARGGSKGIPRKNLRPLNGYPLLYYSIRTALQSTYNTDVYVSSEDDEILMFARRFGAKTIKRSEHLSGDSIPLDPVIEDAYRRLSEKKKYDLVITVQPTSPLLKSPTLDSAIQQMVSAIDTDVLISATEDRHLAWKLVEGLPMPDYEARLNRQELPAKYKESGSFVICRAENLEKAQKRITGKVDIFVLPDEEAIDIDGHLDWALAEHVLQRKKVVFVVTGSQETGSGHAYRALELANLLTKHELHFLTTQGSHVAQKIIGKTNYNLHQQSAKTLLEEINSMQPDVVINDILDTEADYVHSLRQKNYTVINFEDLGAGAKKANAVINALYPPDFSSQNIYSGPEYFIARDEFIYHQEKIVNANVKEVLITFGGTDPSNLTQKTVEALLPLAKELNFRLKIILGIGYSEKKWLQKHPELPVLQNVNNISDHFYAADLIFTSAGRTVYEIACIGTPTIVMAQNAREMTHLFANENNGFIHLGLGKNTTVKALQEAFKMVYSDEKKRTNMNQRMLSKKLKESKANLLELLNKTIG